MKTSYQQLPIYDLYQTAFLSLNGVPVDYERQGTRVVFLVPGTPEVYQLLSEYNNSPRISLLDYVSSLRRIRGQMLSIRDNHENGKIQRKGDFHEQNYNR